MEPLHEIVNSIKVLAVAYENFFDGKRELGITGEIGEVVICKMFNLKLNENRIEEGYDALDEEGKRVQIKCIRKGKGDIKKSKSGRVSTFSKHPFDYCYVALFDSAYEVQSVYKISYEEVELLLNGKKRRNPMAKQLLSKKRADLIYPYEKVLVRRPPSLPY